MQKIIEETNAINWFEIPVLNMERAKNFYETILDITMQTQHVDETNEDMAFFPFTGSSVRATSGRVSGVLTKSGRNKPSNTGTLVYINANPSITTVIEKVEAAGGSIVMPVTKIMAGLIAVIIDTEGNRIGLHSAV